MVYNFSVVPAQNHFPIMVFVLLSIHALDDVADVCPPASAIGKGSSIRLIGVASCNSFISRLAAERFLGAVQSHLILEVLCFLLVVL